ncbi:hypothetical protein [Nocardia bovistercoris]|uniref:Carrier domain-containing protein n=1 Tax=Nocardia bovistercoris TaxID=2785916 RepID=A0A931N507_9NOCA|nr:hypothetical protein [Nocardia bovistercoris]MBH0779257.1 hypothetical protein [Nocardia bovistercoris]
MKDRILELVRSTFDEINLTRSEKIPLDNILDIGLYGENGLFDSMHLVSFLSLLEEQIEDELDFQVSLTSEKAVSRRVSPFSSVTNLVGFIEEELQDAGVSEAV